MPPVYSTRPMPALLHVNRRVQYCDATRGGDPRIAIKALLIENHIQEQRIERLAASLSFGYVRGRIGEKPAQSGPSHREATAC